MDDYTGGLKEQLEHFNQVQEEIKNKVDGVHSALYDPDEGLFARIKLSAEEARQKDHELENKITTEVTVVNKRLDELEGWKSRVTSIGKWVLSIWTTTTVGVIVKFAYDLIQNHIRFI